MNRELPCIECPKGCRLSVDAEDGHVITLTGNQCPKGAIYGRQEIENPLRTLTTSVAAVGLELPMVPVRTSLPIPKSKLAEAMEAVRGIRLSRPIAIHETVVPQFLGLPVDLIATRTVRKPE